LYNYVDLFAGCGGLSLGVERSGGHLQLAVEKSDMAAYTFFSNFVDDSLSDEEWRRYVAQGINGQIEARVAVASLRAVLNDETGMSRLAAAGVDVVVGGPPCQGFSLAGRRNPDDVRNKLPWEYLEFVKRTNPKIVVIENVVGMSHKFARDEESPFVQLQQALKEEGAGYVVQGVAVNALHYGAPQTRPRLMIIGLRSDLAKANGIEATGKLWISGFLDELSGPVPTLAPQSPSVGDAIGDLQAVLPPTHNAKVKRFKQMIGRRDDWGLPRSKSNGVENQSPRNHAPATRERFRLYQWLRDNDLSPRLIADLAKGDTSESTNVREKIAKAVFPAKSPDGTMLAKNPDEMLIVMARLKTRKHSQKALSWELPARTVVTLPDDYVHPSEPRIFTVREMARFQGFPDDFVFKGKETTGSLRRRFEVPQYSQVGNAVSPFLAYAVGQMIAQVLGANGETPDGGGAH
jgi:DNA (cytosine-5)-methyltransferase 1